MENTAWQQGRRKLAEWQRGGAERMIAGVCAALARQLDIPLPLVRALFVVAAVVPSTRSAGVVLYLALWFLTPPAPGESSGLERVVNAVSSFGFGPRRSGDGGGHSSAPYGAEDGGSYRAGGGHSGGAESSYGAGHGEHNAGAETGER